jgi:hypothetical protein
MRNPRKSASAKGAKTPAISGDALAAMVEKYLELERGLLEMALAATDPNAAPDTPKLTIPQAMLLLKMHQYRMKALGQIAAQSAIPDVPVDEAKAELLRLFMTLKDAEDDEE